VAAWLSGRERGAEGAAVISILAIDPGTRQSAWCLLGEDGKPKAFGIDANEVVLDRLEGWSWGIADVLAIEMVASFGMAVGEDVFRTVWWSGRFAQEWISVQHGSKPIEIFRKDEKVFLCHSMKATDANIRQALIDLYGGEGGKGVAIGSKAKPGPCYGMSKDMWSALAVAVTARSKIEFSSATLSVKAA
jgi:hypothetical protein